MSNSNTIARIKYKKALDLNGLSGYCQECVQEMDELRIDCRRCGGSGEIEWDDGLCSEVEMIECYVCKGTGEPK